MCHQELRQSQMLSWMVGFLIDSVVMHNKHLKRFALLLLFLSYFHQIDPAEEIKDLHNTKGKLWFILRCV